jgi:hypothetical protein
MGQQNLAAIPRTFVLQLPPELVHTYIRNRLRQTMVLQHAAHIQVFQHDRRLGFRQQCGCLMQGVPADVCYTRIDSRQLSNGFPAVGASLLTS